MAKGRHFGINRSYFGEDSTSGGHEVKMFGATTGKYVRWNSTDNQLEISGNSSQTGNADINGTLTVADTLTASSAVILPIENGSSSALTLSNFGISVVGATSGGTRTFTLTAPVAGVLKAIICNELSSTGTDIAVVKTGSTAVFFGSSDTQITYGDINTGSLLVGLSAANWGIISNSGTLGSYAT